MINGPSEVVDESTGSGEADDGASVGVGCGRTASEVEGASVDVGSG